MDKSLTSRNSESSRKGQMESRQLYTRTIVIHSEKQ